MTKIYLRSQDVVYVFISFLAARCVEKTSDTCVEVIGDVDYAIDDEKPGKTLSQDIKDLVNKIVKQYRDRYSGWSFNANQDSHMTTLQLTA